MGDQLRNFTSNPFFRLRSIDNPPWTYFPPMVIFVLEFPN